MAKKKEVVRQRANLWSKGRKRARGLIKAWKEQLEAGDELALARINSAVECFDYYRDAFQDEIDSDPAYYDDVTEEDMMAELAKPKHVPWFKQAYCKYAKGQGFIKDIPGCKKCSWLTLTRKHQPYKIISRKGKQLTATTTNRPR